MEKANKQPSKANIIVDGEVMQTVILSLTEIKVDKVNWLIYYQNNETKEKWVKEYPNSNYHGGGAPQLRKIEKFPWE